MIVVIESPSHLPLCPCHRRGSSLGTWCKHRRQDYMLGRLTPDQIRQLEELPGWTWGQEETRQVRPKSRADFSEWLAQEGRHLA